MNCLTANSISTSRGNPIAMATGNAVLDFIDSHELQANAVEVGRFLFDGLRELATRYSLIGEVRGTGLMLGFELIEPKAKVPAVAATNAVLAQCRERGLLIGKGGLLGNVLRVTPPMTVTLFLRRWFVLFFIDHGTRHVHIAGITRNPTDPWITQQARNYLVDLGDHAESISFLTRDRGPYFTDSSDAVFQAIGVHVIPTLPQVPRMNAIAEHWTGSCRREATDPALITGERHLRRLVREYTEHYNRHRPHRSLAQRAPDRLNQDAEANNVLLHASGPADARLIRPTRTKTSPTRQDSRPTGPGSDSERSHTVQPRLDGWNRANSL